MDKLPGAINEFKLDKNHETEGEMRLMQLMNEAILNGHTCPGWLNNLPRIPDDELQNTLDVYTSALNNFAERGEDIESALEYGAVASISKRCVQAYILTIQKNYDQVPIIIFEAFKLLTKCLSRGYISRYYADGFRHVIRTLEIFYFIQKCLTVGNGSGLELVDLRQFLKDLNAFSDLSYLNQVGVLALKYFFVANVSRRRFFDQRIEIIKEVIKMDPFNIEWRCCLYVSLKYRRENQDSFGPPSDEEKEALLAGLKLPGAESDPRMLLNRIMYLSGLIRNDYKVRKHNICNSTPLEFGRKTFFSEEEVVDFIRREAEKIFTLDQVSTRSNISIAKLFSSVLPRNFRDYVFVKSCIERSIKLCPHSSKAYHRMGVLYIQAKWDLLEALAYCKIAYERDPQNWCALLDILHIYLSDAAKNGKELSFLFNEILTGDYYPRFPQSLSKFIFTKALYKLLRGEQRNTIEELVKAYDAHKEDTLKHFKEIQHNAGRFNWFQNVRGKNILGQIRQYLFDAQSQCTQNVSRKVKLSKMLEAAEAAQKASQKNYEGGGKETAGRGGGCGVRGGGRGRGRGGHRGRGRGLRGGGGQVGGDEYGEEDGENRLEGDDGNIGDVFEVMDEKVKMCFGKVRNRNKKVYKETFKPTILKTK